MVPVTCDPEGKLDRVPLDQLEEFQGNLKSLGKTEYAKLKQSIAEKGFIVPVFAWRNGSDKWKLLDGHQRIRVIRNEGWEIDGGIPIVEIAATDEKDAKEKLLAIVSRYGRVEGQGLYEFLDGTGIDLEQWAVPDLPDLDLDSWLDEFIRDPEVPQGDPDAVPEVPEEPTTKLGDLWILGDHRVLCGDSSTLTDLDRSVNGVDIDAVIADPPYGMRLNADFSGMKNKLNFTAKKGVKAGRKYDDVIGDDADFDAAFLIEYFAGVDNQIWFGADYYSATLPNASHSGAWLVWDKRLDESADLMFGSTFELIWSKRKCKRDMLRHKWAGIFGFEKEPIRGRVHPNQKPVALYTDIIDRFTDVGNAIYDPFLGSGNVIITAEKTGRTCYGTEIAPQYVDVIVKRWQDYTGKEATLESDGRTFNEMGAERGVELAVV